MIIMIELLYVGSVFVLSQSAEEASVFGVESDVLAQEDRLALHAPLRLLRVPVSLFAHVLDRSSCDAASLSRSALIPSPSLADLCLAIAGKIQKICLLLSVRPLLRS